MLIIFVMLSVDIVKTIRVVFSTTFKMAPSWPLLILSRTKLCHALHVITYGKFQENAVKTVEGVYSAKCMEQIDYDEDPKLTPIYPLNKLSFTGV